MPTNDPAFICLLCRSFYIPSPFHSPPVDPSSMWWKCKLHDRGRVVTSPVLTGTPVKTWETRGNGRNEMNDSKKEGMLKGKRLLMSAKWKRKRWRSWTKSALKSSRNVFSSEKNVGASVSSQKESTLKETRFVVVQNLINHFKNIIPVILGPPSYCKDDVSVGQSEGKWKERSRGRCTGRKE